MYSEYPININRIEALLVHQKNPKAFATKTIYFAHTGIGWKNLSINEKPDKSKSRGRSLLARESKHSDIRSPIYPPLGNEKNYVRTTLRTRTLNQTIKSRMFQLTQKNCRSKSPATETERQPFTW